MVYFQRYLMAIIFVVVSGIFVALSNLCMRKSIDGGGTTKAFLIFQMAMGFLIHLLLGPLQGENSSFNLPIGVFGSIAGMVLAVMLFSLGKALENGPPGFTFSIIASATVMPGVVMAAFFGESLGFPYTPWHAIGSAVVLLGIFWGGFGLEGLRNKTSWIFFSCSMFVLHTLLLVLFQLRSLWLTTNSLNSFFTPQTIQSPWFIPAMFFTASLFQFAFFLKAEKRWPHRREVLYGVLGGSANAICTYFLIQATEIALPLENAIIFPIYSVVSIVLSNLWGQKLYEEKVNWKACQLCASGLIIGTVDWSALIT